MSNPECEIIEWWDSAVGEIEPGHRHENYHAARIVSVGRIMHEDDTRILLVHRESRAGRCEATAIPRGSIIHRTPLLAGGDGGKMRKALEAVLKVLRDELRTDSSQTHGPANKCAKLCREALETP